MFQVGDYIVYKRDVCLVRDFKKNHYANRDYYILSPVCDDSLTLEVPADSKNGYLRAVISKKEAEQLIDQVPIIEVVACDNRMMEHEYQKLLRSNQLEDLVKIIKTAYQRNEKRALDGKRIGEKDDTYFKNAEKYLYSELAISLGKSPEEVKQYIIDRVINLTSNNA